MANASSSFENINLQVNENLCVRLLRTEDITDPYVAWLNDKDICKYLEQRFLTFSRASVEKYVNDISKSDESLLFGIFFRNIHIGNIKLGDINRHHRTTNLSYLIGKKEYWGQSIATSCLKALLSETSNRLPIRKVYSSYYMPNKASERVLLKCGFSIEAVLKNHVILEGIGTDVVIVSRFL